MDIFVSWAGRDSHAAALVLHQWLPGVLPVVRPWVSSEDIRKGTRWSEQLWGRLQMTSYCIVCLTPAAVRSPWVNFEAGAVARAVGGRAHVSPLLLGLSPRDLDGVPLAMFQCTEFTRRDIERLVKAINAVAARPIPESEVSLRLRREWPVLRDQIGDIEISGDDSEEAGTLEDEPLDGWLDETEVKILEHVAWWGHEKPLGVMDTARSISENHIVTQHYLDQLVRRRFLREHRNAANPSTYSVTRRGRAYIVEEQI